VAPRQRLHLRSSIEPPANLQIESSKHPVNPGFEDGVVHLSSIGFAVDTGDTIVCDLELEVVAPALALTRQDRSKIGFYARWPSGYQPLPMFLEQVKCHSDCKAARVSWCAMNAPNDWSGRSDSRFQKVLSFEKVLIGEIVD